MNITNPFLDPSRQAELYGHASRLTGRSNALLRAKTSGRPVPDAIVQLVRAHHERPGRLGLVLDVGCGRGTSSMALAEQLRPRHVIGLDAAPALIEQARRRARHVPGLQLSFLRGDFHQIPLPTSSCDVAVAAFCLYHSTHPQKVIAELGRVLRPEGLAVLVTKDLDSYQEMDELVAAAGLDLRATGHESLYVSAHSATSPAWSPRRSTCCAPRTRSTASPSTATTTWPSTWPPTRSTTCLPACTATRVQWQQLCATSCPIGH